jgi:hypothetical protein
LVKDLIWGEKSPAVVAIAVNVAIVIIPLALFTLLSPAQSATDTDAAIAAMKVNESRPWALFGITVNASLMQIYASIAQLLLFMRTQQRTFWTTGTLGALILLPPTIFAVLRIGNFSPLAVLLSIVFPFALLLGSEKAFLLIPALGLILVLLNLQLTRQLRQAGEQIKESSHATSS